jgi:uncharacterized protein (TIGR02145 family)
MNCLGGGVKFPAHTTGKKLKSNTGWDNWTESLNCDKCSYWTDDQRKYNYCEKCRNTKRIKGKTLSGNGTNISGFSALPSGKRDGLSNNFKEIGSSCYFWSSDHHSWVSRSLSEINRDRYKNCLPHQSCLNSSESLRDDIYDCSGGGYSVRCIKD